MSSRPLFRSPFSILALAGMVAIALGLYSRAAHPARFREGLPQECLGLSAQECQVRLGLAKLQEAQEIVGTPLPAQEACVDAGYLCAELDGDGILEVLRWPVETSQIRIWVPEPEDLPPGLARDFQNAAARGIRAWNGHPIPLSVRTRKTGESPDATVQWVSSMEGDRLGRAEIEWARSGEIVRVRVLGFTVNTHQPGTEGRALTPQEVELVAAHEMGHVLGLPHSDDARDVMFPQNTATRLTARDFRTLAALYSLPNGAEIRR